LALLRRANDPDLMDGWLATGNALSIAAGRISHLLGFHGPCTVVDTACSSSLLAVHLACESLRRGASSLAVAGGTGLILGPEVTISLTKAQAMSPDGRCKTFDASANGYVRSEGCGIVVLQKLSEAQKEGRPVLAVIRATAVNHDGKSSGVTVPNVNAQALLLKEALTKAGIASERVEYLEAHGTGTPLGDPIELRAVSEVYGQSHNIDRPLYVGSVKTNLGHLEAAAGVAGLIKTVLALQNNAVPPHLHFHQPNPFIPWNELPIKIPLQLTPWPKNDITRCAGVSSFGFSGTNVHLLITDPPGEPVDKDPPDLEHKADLRDHLLCLSARSEESLRMHAANIAGLLRQKPDIRLEDLCRSAHFGFSHEDHRLAAIFDSSSQLAARLEGFSKGKAIEEEDGMNTATVRYQAALRHTSPRIAFLFTGQGCQYQGMTHRLYETEPRFRQTLDRCEQILRPIWDKSLLDLLYNGQNMNREDFSPLLDLTTYTQPALFAVGYALADLWRSWGIIPSAVMGHSVGEYTAACFAGLFSLEDGLRSIAERAKYMGSLPAGGAMAAVMADESCVQGTISQYKLIEIAALNNPFNTVITGPEADISPAIEDFTRAGITVTRLNVSHAFHSSLMNPILDQFKKAMRTIRFSKPEIGIVSNLTGRFITENQASQPDYWCNHLRRPVRFSDGIRTLTDAGYKVFVEVGPQPTLLGIARGCIPPSADIEWIPSLRKDGNDTRHMTEALRSLYLCGASVDWHEFHRGRPEHWIDLPCTPFVRRRYWPVDGMYRPPDAAIQPDTATRESSEQKTDPASIATTNGRFDHPFLGRRLMSPLFGETLYERILTEKTPPFVRDHQVHSLTVIPGASHLSMALSIGEQEGIERICLENVSFPEALIIEEDHPRTMQFILDPPVEKFPTESRSGENLSKEDRTRRWRIVSQSPEDHRKWFTHAAGEISPLDHEFKTPRAPGLEAVKERCLHQSGDLDRFYRTIAQTGVQLGPSFQWNRRFWRRDYEVLSRLEQKMDDRELEDYILFPGLIDSCIQLIATAIPTASLDNSAHIPVHVKHLILYNRPRSAMWCHFTLNREKDDSGYTGSFLLFDDEKTVIASADSIRFQRAPRTALLAFARRRLRDWLFRLRWVPQENNPLSDSAAGDTELESKGAVLIFADSKGLAERITTRLKNQGFESVLVRPEGESAAQNIHQIDPGKPELIDQLLSAALPSRSTHWSDVLYLWSDTSEPELDQLTGDYLESTQSLVMQTLLGLSQSLARLRTQHIPKLWIITRGVQSLEESSLIPRIAASPVWGFSRVLRLEVPQLECRRVDLDPAGEPDHDADHLMLEMKSRDGEDQIVYRDNKRYVGRLLRGADTPKKAADKSILLSGEPYRLVKSERGVIEDLAFRPALRLQPAAGEIEISVQATGLNFRDVLNTLNLYPGEAGPLGLECAGFVSAIGEGVSEYAVGDRIVAIAPGCFAQFAVTDIRLTAPLPDSISFEDGASLPIIFITAQLGLRKLANLKEGETLLIHSAAGGVGHAALEVARRVGARVIATAGSKKKREYLKSKGIEHVFDSRSFDFADQVLEVTKGRGVDVIMNFLPGEAIAHNFHALAETGRFIEIGKIGIWEPHRVAEKRPDAEYHTMALDDLVIHQPSTVGNLLREVMKDFGRCDYKPPPLETFPIEDVQDAFRFMAQAMHIGKVVVQYPETDINTNSKKGSLKSSRTWLLTGGLGALGIHCARWLVMQGVKRLVLVSRNMPSSQASKVVKELKKTGAEIIVRQVDICDRASVDSLLEEADNKEYPLGGILHLAGVLDDGMIENQNWSRFEKVLRPKILGALHLHQATRNRDIDAFILYSSAASMIGSPGQSNYAAANSFLDALAHARHAIGLPATSINWGPWKNGGMASRNEETAMRQWDTIGLSPLSPEDALEVMQMLLEEEAIQAAVLSIDWQRMLGRFPPGTEPPLLSALASEQHASLEPSKEWLELVERIKEAPPAERIDLLVDYVRQDVAQVLGFGQAENIDPHAPLNELGFDSLMAVEMANRITTAAGIILPVTLLFDYPTIHAISGYVVRDIMKLECGDTPPATTARSRDTTAKDVTSSLIESIEKLSEEDVKKQME
jgi:acyl transferase domain-containing protein/NADPH:quinone reductase-like Zn-dependent oxidoreductase/short-subunit dehydrogenase/acyl carrier protein